MDQNILIVEDHQGVRKSLREWLGISFPQYQLLEATTGEEAITMAQATSPCLVIMDIGLPGMSGLEATVAIKKSLPSTQVVMLTVYDDDDYRNHAAAAGASAYVAKRKVKTDLLPTIRRVLEGRKGEAPP
ncbi:MAG: response regulator transcription factor [Deltaproteobacteria bacterium]|nr:response regulator transcription factor [Deltaproteobacteria bacterium]